MVEARRLAWLLFAVVFAWTSPVSAQNYPTHPITLVVPFPAGGATDAAARAMQPQLEKLFGQTVVIENRAGAGAVIGLDAIAKSAPDGYTFGIGPAGALSVNPAMQVKMPFDVRKDLTPISGLCETPFILAAAANYPANTLQEVIAQAKAKPGTLNFASAGLGSTSHLAGEVFKRAAGIDIRHVPYRGAESVMSVMRGDTHMTFSPAPVALELINTGKVRPIAVVNGSRIATLPNVPTFAEAGAVQFDYNAWFGLFAPLKTPKPVVDKIAGATRQILETPEIKKYLAQQGADSAFIGSDAFDKIVKADAERYGKLLVN